MLDITTIQDTSDWLNLTWHTSYYNAIPDILEICLDKGYRIGILIHRATVVVFLKTINQFRLILTPAFIKDKCHPRSIFLAFQ